MKVARASPLRKAACFTARHHSLLLFVSVLFLFCTFDGLFYPRSAIHFVGIAEPCQPSGGCVSCFSFSYDVILSLSLLPLPESYTSSVDLCWKNRSGGSAPKVLSRHERFLRCLAALLLCEDGNIHGKSESDDGCVRWVLYRRCISLSWPDDQIHVKH